MKKVSIFIYFLLILLSSCSSVKINTATRKIVYPGVSSGKESMVYEIVFKASSEFTIDEILLEGNSISNYSIQNINTRIYEDVGKNNFKAGDYKLIFKTSEIDDTENNNMLTLLLIEKEHKRKISINVRNINSVHRR